MKSAKFTVFGLSTRDFESGSESEFAEDLECYCESIYEVEMILE